MDQQLEKIREVQKEAWNKSSSGWKKWDDITMSFLKPAGDEIIRMLQLDDEDYVLDVATGTGEPGLTMASMLKKGKVTGVDLSDEMLSVARENALRRGIKNFATVSCDVSDLPFENNSFDAVSCRFGFMFFPDMQLALNEMIRVLKPGGHLAASVWNLPEKNSWITTSMETMISMLQLKLPAPGAPGLFRCAQPGLMEELFKNSQLKNIRIKEVKGELRFDTPEMYWNFISEVACPAAYQNADQLLKDQIKQAVLEKVTAQQRNGQIILESHAMVLCGEK